MGSDGGSTAARDWPISRLAVNVSPVQFRQASFVSQVSAILSATGFSAGRLELEITESKVLEGFGSPDSILGAFRREGVRISLDDFGTGYSSLSYLRNLQVDRIKIDRSFVQHLGEAQSSYSIVEAIIALARALNIDVTAEGVETLE